MNLKTLSFICLIFFSFVVISYSYIGMTSIPTEGDSLNYHIPIAKSYLDGTVFTPEKIQGVPFLKYSPGSTEAILAIFFLLSIPANLFNVLGVLVFFFSLYYLGRKFGLEKDYSLIFASSVATLNGIVRWLDTQKVDIFMASYFVFALALLQKPEKKLSYFLKLGFFLGMLIGSKYSGLLFAAVLIAVYLPLILRYINLKRILVFSFPFFIFGGSWYLRNYLSSGNPMYPQGFLFFKDAGFTILNHQVWKVVTGSWFGFFGTINALVSEYMIWLVSIPMTLVYFLKRRLKTEGNILSLIILGVCNCIIYSFLPSDNIDHIMVSVIRYSYVAFIPFVLTMFILARKYKKQDYLGVVAVANMFAVGFPMSYNPKILLLFIPVALLLYYFQSRK